MEAKQAPNIGVDGKSFLLHTGELYYRERDGSISHVEILAARSGEDPRSN